MTTTNPPSPRVTPRDIVVWSVLALGALLIVVLGLRRNLSGPPQPPPRVFYELPDFSLTNRDGREVTLADLSGAPFIADFIFTSCRGICPFMTKQMSRLAHELPDERVRLVSFSVDPETDTPEVLDAYARENGSGDDWYFLTGAFEDVRALSREGFKLGLEAAEPTSPTAADEPIVHSNRFVLVDGRGRVRGYYDAFDESEVQRLLLELAVVLDEE